MRELNFKPALLFWLFIAAFFPACASFAQDTIQVRTNFYRVSGDTIREIQQSLNREKFRAGAGQHEGMTVWKIDWNCNFTQNGGNFRLSSFTTKTTITITLPLWTYSTNAAPEVIKVWRDYLVALSQHEQGHVQIAKDAVVEMRRRAEAVGAETSANALKTKLHAVCTAVVNEHREKEKDYDAQTQHGIKQGAVLRRTR